MSRKVSGQQGGGNQSSFQMIAAKLSFSKPNNGTGAVTKGSVAPSPLVRQSSTKSNGSDNDDSTSARTNDDDDLTFGDDAEVMSEVDDSGVGVLATLGRVAKRGAKAIVRTVLDYGPPYKRTFDVALINECAKPVLNHMEVHNLLNQRVNPNLADPDDLYYTPMHWCVRNGHLMGIKMLRRAGARINVTNEMGVTPLDLIVMMKHSPDRRSLQLKVVKYLLRNGAFVNNVDKGGFSAIDHAAVNQDLELIELLLEHGAKLRRENNILVAKRRPILDLVIDPDCYRTIYEALLVEEREANRRKMERDRTQKLKEDERYYEKLHATLNKRKQRRQERERKEDNEFRADIIMAERMEAMRKERQEQLKKKELWASEQGEWKKAVDTTSNSSDSMAVHWNFERKTRLLMTGEMLYQQNKETMKSLQKVNNVQIYNRTWNKLTGGGNLELKWPREEKFFTEEDRPKMASRHGTPFAFQQEERGSVSGTSSSLTASGMLALGNDVFYMDENDDALQGEDSLDDLISDLNSL
ncbi:ankyrin repeat domain-containing protein [archaeon]|nr:MAG: ankyrin repeat domain-containing protein [archaeon]